MSEKFTSNNIENDEFIQNEDERDYKNLITRLKEIRETIALLKNKYLEKF